MTHLPRRVLGLAGILAVLALVLLIGWAGAALVLAAWFAA
jgi:hypothetical protein